MAHDVQGGGVIGLIFGVIAGTCVGLSWAYYGEGSGWVALLSAAVVGALGYFYGDRFWLWFGRNFRFFT